MDHERQTGEVKRFFEKGFGFIKVDGSDKEIFVHISETGGKELREGDRVSFVLGQGPKGELAKDVRMADEENQMDQAA